MSVYPIAPTATTSFPPEPSKRWAKLLLRMQTIPHGTRCMVTFTVDEAGVPKDWTVLQLGTVEGELRRGHIE